MLVSEVMLQQTQASRVVEPWLRFMDRFPTPAACAAEPPASVLRAWSGLGYNRRAVALHRTASVLVDRHGGAVPTSLPDLVALPGVGPYTARAVLAFAFDQDVAVVDTNVRRVLTRAWLGANAPPASLQRHADSLVPTGRGWAFNQALMDLGARVCTSRRPACAACPLADCCRWRTEGYRQPDPGSPPTRQSPFAGSDRQGRGRLVEALRRRPLRASELAAAAGWPADERRAQRVADDLVGEGLAEVAPDGRLRLAGDQA